MCEICGLKMSQYFILDDHKKKVHGEKKIKIIIDAYRNMIKSGKYEFLKNIPTNITSRAKKIEHKRSNFDLIL